jgi:hypothetical protein
MDERLTDFTYPADERPAGVFERAMSDAVITTINGDAEIVGHSLATARGQRQDCRYSCAWERTLRSRGLDLELLGGEGVDGDDFTLDYQAVPLDRRSGYREGDGLVHRHYWLGIGPDRLIFDPTAHQFDDRAGCRWIVTPSAGRPATASRTAWQTDRAARTSGR